MLENKIFHLIIYYDINGILIDTKKYIENLQSLRFREHLAFAFAQTLALKRLNLNEVLYKYLGNHGET